MIFADGSKQKLSLTYDLSVEIDITWTYIDGSGNDENSGLDNGFSIKKDDWSTPSKTRLSLDGSADLSMTTTIYFTQVDDLCDPRIREAEKMEVSIKVVVIPETEAEGA